MVLSSQKNGELDRIMAKAVLTDTLPPMHSSADVSGIKDAIASLGGHLDHHSTDIGLLGSEARFIFTLDSGTFTLTLNICKDHETALDVMRQHLSTYQVPLETVFVRPAVSHWKGQVGLESDGRSIWIRDNVLFILGSAAVGQDCEFLAKTLDNIFIDWKYDHLIDPGSYNQPSRALVPIVQDIRGPTVAQEVGTEFFIEVVVDAASEMRAMVDTGNVLLLSIDKEKRNFRFLARYPGEDTVTFIFAHSRTLFTTAQSFKVQVVGDRVD
jgi:hypothetical protein